LLARAVAGEAHVPFFSLTGSDFVEMFVGVGAARVRDLFQQAQARRRASCSSMSSTPSARRAGRQPRRARRARADAQSAARRDGWVRRQEGLIIMAATNRPETLDSALMRPGRFDRQVLVDRPDVKGREDILRVHARACAWRPRSTCGAWRR